MKIAIQFKSLAPAALLMTTSLLCGQSHAALEDLGHGLIYDSVSNVTWLSDGYAFTYDMADETANPTGNPYTGPLLGTVVTPNGGTPHALEASDIQYVAGLGRWLGTWYGATAWAERFTYQFGDRTVSDWRLPTATEAENLISAVGPTKFGAQPPFTYVPPFYWTSTLVSSSEAYIGRPAFGVVDVFSFMNGSVPRLSNIWAVAPGKVSVVPVPGAVWLFGSAIGAIGFGGWRKSRKPS